MWNTLSNTAAAGDSGIEQFFSEIFSAKNDCINYFLIIIIWNKWVDCFLGILFLECLALFSFQRRVKSMKLAVNFGNPFPLFLYIGWLICWLCMRNLLFLLVCLFGFVVFSSVLMLWHLTLLRSCNSSSFWSREGFCMFSFWEKITAC